METLLLIFLSILPAIILLWYFERQDKGRKEPRKLKWKIFGWGIMAAIFAVIIELNIEDAYTFFSITPESNFWIYTFLTAFITASLTEEAIKLWVVKTHIYKDKNFDEVMDGITYTIIASLGLATFENVFYVIEGGYSIAIIRALISVPAHALFSGIMGFYIGKSKFASSEIESRNLLIKGFLWGFLYHGLFDFFLFSQTLLYVLVLPLMIIMGMHLKSKIKLAQYADNVINAVPEKITIKRILKILLVAILIITGTLSIIGSIVLSQDVTSGYTEKEILYSCIFGGILFLISFFILRKKKPILHQNSL